MKSLHRWIFVFFLKKGKNNRAWVENEERRAHVNKTSKNLFSWRMKSDTNISTRAHFTPKDFLAAMKMRKIRTEMWKSRRRTRWFYKLFQMMNDICFQFIHIDEFMMMKRAHHITLESGKFMGSRKHSRLAIISASRASLQVLQVLPGMIYTIFSIYLALLHLA